MTDKLIVSLVKYGLDNGLITELDKKFVTNYLLGVMQKDSIDLSVEAESMEVAQILDGLCDIAVEKGIIGDGITEHDLFDTKLMSVFTPYPREVISFFNILYKKSPKEATDWFYNLAIKTNYIRKDRIEKDMKWLTDTEYGQLEITINLSKPEKDPKAIAAAGKAATGNKYPACALCMENEGYFGRLDHPARENLRIIPFELGGEEWGLQYSPYVYYNEHCIVLSSEHRHMKVSRDSFVRLLEFVEKFPHYFVGSNADLPIVGGSILSHDHFQGGCHVMPMAKAPVEKTIVFKGFEDVSAGILKWPMSVIRLEGKDKDRIIELSDKILGLWRAYSDVSVGIIAESDGEKHNTITPIARRNGDNFVMDLVLRCNITSKEHPLGVFHPHAKLHHIKKENIGLIEVMGLAVLPGRLKKELDDIAKAMLAGSDISSDENLSKHAEWCDEIKAKYEDINEGNVEQILHDEVGLVFNEVLKDAGVYKDTEEGRNAFLKFVDSVNI